MKTALYAIFYSSIGTFLMTVGYMERLGISVIVGLCFFIISLFVALIPTDDEMTTERVADER